jgi:hypothetical protein
MADNGSGRLDRVERILQELAERQQTDHEQFTENHEQFVRDHQQLLKWQVLTQDRIDRLFDLTDRNAAQIGQLSDRIDKLVIAIGSLVERLPR